jgi:DNA polymerase III alpha subunit (gram-positive type)|uniref:Exonuclease domain-containing protein n=1 Tax=viral metagenome TaxID=1070528 RepID=A0A6C0IQX9_9ZZZZ
MPTDKFLIFDTETTGLLPRGSGHKVHKYNTHQYPHIVQFSWMIYDNNLKKVTKIEDHVIRLPEGMEVPEASSNVHGITTKIMRMKGENVLNVLKIFTKDMLDSNYLVAHNINFDKTIVRAEYLRNNQIDWMGRHRKKEYCTLANSINVCNLIRQTKSGRNYKKFPKLMETHQTLFKTIPKNLHNSLIDIYVCFRCFHMLNYDFDILKKNKEFKKQFNHLCGL